MRLYEYIRNNEYKRYIITYQSIKSRNLIKNELIKLENSEKDILEIKPLDLTISIKHRDYNYYLKEHINKVLKGKTKKNTVLFIDDFHILYLYNTHETNKLLKWIMDNYIKLNIVFITSEKQFIQKIKHSMENDIARNFKQCDIDEF